MQQESQKTINTISGLNEKVVRLSGELQKTEIGTASFKKIQKELDETNKKIQEATQNTGFFSKMFSGVGGMITGTLAGIGITQLAGNIVTLGSKLEQTKVSFTTMLGSAEKADAFLRDLAVFAQNTPFEIQGLRDTSKQLLAFGFGADEIIPTLKSLGDVASGLSVPVEQLAYAYGQVRTSGQLYGTELMQFTNAGVPLLAELAKMYGTNEAAIKKMIEQGKIGFPAVEEAFRRMSSEGGTFANMMDAQSNTLAGQWARLMDILTAI